jgi:hypothetical protein
MTAGIRRRTVPREFERTRKGVPGTPLMIRGIQVRPIAAVLVE